MSIPRIPGFTGRREDGTLGDLWASPDGDFPEELWPGDVLASISSRPTGWLVVEEHFFTKERHGGTGCVLCAPRDADAALEHDSWIGRDLGEVGVWDDGRFDAGLSTTENDVDLDFFVHVRRPSGATMPVVEVSHPFLWYWDAFPIENGWSYVNRAGRDQDLVRWSVSDDNWRVEVRALEFRRYLEACGRSAILQLDYVTKVDAEEFDRIDDVLVTEWARCSFHALHELAMGDRPAYSRLLGQYVLNGQRNSRVPRWEERRQDRLYPNFIYGVNPDTGEPLTHTCNPSKLGTYFDKDGSRLHYLTPAYFKREVLQPYVSEPSRYRVSATRLECLDLWGIDISFNSAGLVEVYLGDLGRDLPTDEWGHWLTYNVPPEGTMDEGRFRRDFLNQVASSVNPPGELRRARVETAEVSERLLGTPLWRPLDREIRTEFESLVGPLNEDPAALGQPLLVLTKALVDAIDPAPLKTYLDEYEPGEKSLRLLERFVESQAGDPELVGAFRNLYAFRSRGGVAHLAGSGRDAAAEELGIAGLSNMDAFESVVRALTASLRAIQALMSETLERMGD